MSIKPTAPALVHYLRRSGCQIPLTAPESGYPAQPFNRDGVASEPGRHPTRGMFNWSEVEVDVIVWAVEK
jgi:hypothetical protein